eukprot:jgi/Mesvir1/10658/Mv13748-RA.1
MASSGVTCFNSECRAPAAKTCSRCRLAYYCCRECQVSDHYRHKSQCKKLSAWLERASQDSSSLNLAQAKDLVAAVARQLVACQGALPATAVSNLVEDSPLVQLRDVALASPKNEKVLGKAGACEVLAPALDTALACGDPGILYEICVSIVALTATCAKNRAAFGRLGAIASATTVLTSAVHDKNWQLAEAATMILNHVADFQSPSHCEVYGLSGTFEAVAAGVVAAVNEVEFPLSAFPACAAMHTLQHMALSCREPGCQNRHRLGQAAGLFRALSLCLVTAKTLAHLTATRAGVHAEESQDALKKLRSVCLGIYAIVQPDAYPVATVQALVATPRLCMDLSTTLALAGSPEHLRARPRCEPAWRLVDTAAKAVYGICVAHRQATLPPDLRHACPTLVDILRVANEEEAGRCVQCDTVIAMKELARDPHMAALLDEAGACEALVETLCQLAERRGDSDSQRDAASRDSDSEFNVRRLHAGDTVLCCNAAMAVRQLARVPNVLRQLASSEETCKTLVGMLRYLVELEAPGWVASVPLEEKPSCVDYWLPMMAAHPTSSKCFLAAGAGGVLAQALEACTAANDVQAMSLFRALAEEMHAGGC